MAVSVTIEKKNDSNARKVKRSVSSMSGDHVLIGWPQGDPKNMRPDGATNSALAALHNSGSEDGKIPPRPFMDEAFESPVNRSKLKRLMLGLALRVIKGQTTSEKALGTVGEAGVDMVKDSIRDGNWKENKPSTVARKGSSRPLIDTEQMLNSVTHKVVTR